MVSWLKLMPIAKIMYDTLSAVIRAQTNKSSSGKITRTEIRTILLGQVDNVVNILGFESIEDEK